MKTCPLGHTCAECRWYIRLRGTNPQTGQEVDNEDCAIAWLPTLLVENSQQQRGTAAAVESFRNEMVRGNENLAAVLMGPQSRRLLG
jgi:hypothetical protein